MLDKRRIASWKSEDLPELYAVLKESKDNRQILLVLENLGHLPVGFDGDVLLPLLQSPNKDIRFWAVKNLGKLKNEKFLYVFFGVAQSDRDSMVRREAVSSIGRIRERSTIPYLEQLLNDVDPKVVLQAIRGLLVFKYNPLVQERLKQLYNHPNEIIQGVISKEFSLNGYSHQTHYLHVQSPDFMKNVVVNSDVRDVLRLVPDESIHLTFTSPPYYNARDYSTYESYSAYLDFLTDVFSALHRVTKEGRFFIVNTSPVIVPRVSRSHSSKRYPIPFDIHARLVEIGWEFIDDIVWAKPEASVKNRNAGFLQHRKPLAYKPNPVTEYLMVYRKKTDKLIDWNIRQYDDETVSRSRVQGNYATSNLWEIDPTFDKVHSAVFPIELCHRVIRFYSYVGDLVFDPFGGSGTMGRAAQNLDRYFFMTEKDDKYFERMKKDLQNKTLFSQHETRFMELEDFQRLSQGEA
jgi:DNA modification methylase